MNRRSGLKKLLGTPALLSRPTGIRDNYLSRLPVHTLVWHNPSTDLAPPAAHGDTTARRGERAVVVPGGVREERGRSPDRRRRRKRCGGRGRGGGAPGADRCDDGALPPADTGSCGGRSRGGRCGSGSHVSASGLETPYLHGPLEVDLTAVVQETAGDPLRALLFVSDKVTLAYPIVGSWCG